MLYAVLAVFGVLIAGLVVMDQRSKRRIQARDARRDARQRARIRDWTVMQWVFGNRASLRITHKPRSERAASDE